jgi:hypothetical protein
MTQTFRNKSAQIYTEWLPLIEHLSDSEAGKLLKNILNYQNGDDITSKNPVWFFVLNKLEEYNGNYDEIRGKRIDAGRLGGIAKASKCQQVLENPSKPTNKTKQNKTKQNKTKSISFLSDDFLRDRKELWIEWLQYKKEVHSNKYKTEKGEKTQFNQFVKFGGDRKYLDKVMCNEWKGFYEIKINKSKTLSGGIF